MANKFNEQYNSGGNNYWTNCNCLLQDNSQKLKRCNFRNKGRVSR